MPKVTWRERSEITTRAIQRKGDFAEAFYNRGLTRYAKGDLEGAQRDYTRAIQRKGDFAEAFYGRGLARRAKGDGKGAQQDFDQAKRLGYG